MPASRYDISVEQHSTFELAVDVVNDNGDPVDLTGYTGSMQIRASYDATDVLAAATVTILADAGRVTAVIDAATTGAGTWVGAVYDLIITNTTRTERIVEGNARLSRSVTHS